MGNSKTLRVALAQLSVLSERPEKNLERVEQALHEAAGAGCRLLVLPELWATGYNLKQRERWASPLGKGLFAEAARLAKAYRVYLQVPCSPCARDGISTRPLCSTRKASASGIMTRCTCSGSWGSRST